jgi:hypothetical protein
MRKSMRLLLGVSVILIPAVAAIAVDGRGRLSASELDQSRGSSGNLILDPKDCDQLTENARCDTPGTDCTRLC